MRNAGPSRVSHWATPVSTRSLGKSGIGLPNAAIEHPPRALLAWAAPLLEEECDALALAGVAQLFDPPCLHGPRAWTGLTADDDPMDVRKIRVDDRTEQGLE